MIYLWLWRLLAVLLFCASALALANEVNRPVTLTSKRRGQALAALRLEKAYRVFSWFFLSLFFMFGFLGWS